MNTKDKMNWWEYVRTNETYEDVKKNSANIFLRASLSFIFVWAQRGERGCWTNHLISEGQVVTAVFSVKLKSKKVRETF